MNAMKIILLALLIALVVPAATAVIAQNFEIIKAEHRTGNCTWADATRTHYSCDVAHQNVTAKIQAIVNGNKLFKFDTRRQNGGLYTEYGLAWGMPYHPGNLGFTMVTYRANEGPVKQLAIRDRCWFSLGQNRVWCPAITIMESMSANMGDTFFV